MALRPLALDVNLGAGTSIFKGKKIGKQSSHVFQVNLRINFLLLIHGRLYSPFCGITQTSVNSPCTLVLQKCPSLVDLIPIWCTPVKGCVWDIGIEACCWEGISRTDEKGTKVFPIFFPTRLKTEK